MYSPFEPTYSHLPLLSSAVRRAERTGDGAPLSVDRSLGATVRRALTAVVAVAVLVFVAHALAGVVVTPAASVATVVVGLVTAAVVEVNRRWHPDRVAGPFDAIDVIRENHLADEEDERS